MTERQGVRTAMPEPASAQPRQATFRIPKHTRHVPDARTQVRKILANWGLVGELSTDVVVVTTEYVTNAVRHCRVTFAQVEVSVSIQGDRLLLEVSDPDKEKVPEQRASVQQDEGGRGLTVVAALAEHWGYDLRRFTKCAWATFPLPDRWTNSQQGDVT
ncbi:ATP-binding protein [Streptomyces sp. NPDC002845]